MDDKGYTRKTTDWLGRPKEEHFDSQGTKVGETRFEKDWLGREVQVHVDSSGAKVGETRQGQDWLGRGRAEHVDASGRPVGTSRDDTTWWGLPIRRHYDAEGRQVGSTRRTSDRLGRPQKEHEGRYFKTAGTLSIPDAPTRETADAPWSSGGHDGGYYGEYRDSTATRAAPPDTARPRKGSFLIGILLVAFGTWAWVIVSRDVLTRPQAQPPVWGQVTAERVNVRVGPNIGSEKMTVLSTGDAVRVFGSSGGWYRIQLADGRMGYVYGAYLVPEHGPRYRVGEAKAGAAVTDSPTGGRVVGTLRRGERFVILGTNDNWVEVQLPDSQGWTPAWAVTERR